jgi:hypothetical protein
MGAFSDGAGARKLLNFLMGRNELNFRERSGINQMHRGEAVTLRRIEAKALRAPKPSRAVGSLPRNRD